MVYLLKMVIFHSYVSLPEGISWRETLILQWDPPGRWKIRRDVDYSEFFYDNSHVFAGFVQTWGNSQIKYIYI